MKLSHITNKILLRDTKNLATAERESTLSILFHLKEIDKRKLYCDLKCTSLFDYCVRELGYSEASALRRIVAARSLEAHPEIASKIKSGRLTLTNISLVNQFIKDPEKQKEILIEVEGLTKKACEKKLFEITGREIDPKQMRVTKDRTALSLPDETIAKIEKLKALLANNLNLEEVIDFAVEEAIKTVEKTKFKQTIPRKSPSPAVVGRVVPASIKREIYVRDKKCVNCGSTHRLNYDHRIPYALGGETSKENIRLLCFNCNQRARMAAKLGSSQQSDYRPHSSS